MTSLTIKVKWLNPVDNSWNIDEHVTDDDPIQFIKNEYMPEMYAEIIEAEIISPRLENIKSALEEQYPHVIEKATLFWGYQEFHQFINELIMANRKRQGFAYDALQEIYFISALHDLAYPEFVKEKEVWSDEYLNMDSSR